MSLPQSSPLNSCRFMTLLTVRKTPEILERIIGVARLRGYSVLSFSAQPHWLEGRMEIALQVESDRPWQRLRGQLACLRDVEATETFCPQEERTKQGQPS